jgi:ketosteroid isomerase-like protein
MRIRSLAPFLALTIVACSAETAEDAAETVVAEETQEYAADADAATLAAYVADWATHYNMGHGSMVADYFTDTGLMWSGSSGIAFGKENIAALLQGGIDMASPQLTLDMIDQIIVGDRAVAYGTFSTQATVDGEASGNSGYWMNYAELIDGEWKTRGLISNVDSEQATPAFQSAEFPEAMESAALAAESTEFFVTHINMGHAEMVAETYAEDIVSMPSGAAISTGRDALLARLTEMAAAGAQFTVTPWAAAELGEDYITSIGTYSVEIGGETVQGHYSNVSRRNADGEFELIWSLTAAHPNM